MIKRKRENVCGVIGVSSIMSNWNADFTGNPKMLSDGRIFGSDKALKFVMRKFWDNLDEKILNFKSSIITDKGQVQFCSLQERYDTLFDKSLKESNQEDILSNLFSCTDVKQFGSTFASSGNNFSIQGAVQIGAGINKYDLTAVEEQVILSPFINSKTVSEDENERAKATTLGKQIIVDEAHYMYPFSICPKQYKEVEQLGITEGYTEKDYNDFKTAALLSVTAFNSCTKKGCDNEFALFIETEEDIILPNLVSLIDFYKEGEKNCINLEKLTFINDMQGIKSIELYYNPAAVDIIVNLEGAKHYNIFTRMEV